MIDTKDYSVPQTRERAIVLMTRKDQELEWLVPLKDDVVITMRDAIGNLPKLDPFITDVDEKSCLRLFLTIMNEQNRLKKFQMAHSTHHIKRQVIVMLHTPTGQTAFDNEVYYPIKADGKPVKGFKILISVKIGILPLYSYNG